MIPLKNILIARTDRIGDVVLSLPLAGEIKKWFPEAKVTFLVREYTASLVRECKNVDLVITLEGLKIRDNFWNAAKALKKMQFDTAIVVYPNIMIGILLVISGLRIRIGTAYRWYSFLFNRKIYDHRKEAKMHELEYNINMLKSIGIDAEPTKSNVLWGFDEFSEMIPQAVSDSGIDWQNKIAIIHPGSGGSAIDLPLNKMKELVRIVSERTKLNILITGSDSEKKLCEYVAGNTRAKVLAGKLELKELMSLINECDLFISNSTGPIHIASALGKNVIGFYPKIKVCSSYRWGPYSVKSEVFVPEIECDNCTRKQCEKLNCMDSIELEKVYKSILEFIK